MIDKFDGIRSRLLDAIADCKQGRISRQHLRAAMFQMAAELEEDQWKVIEDLRSHGADAVADVLEATLREGSGNA